MKSYRVVGLELISAVLFVFAVVSFTARNVPFGLFLLTLGLVGALVPVIEAGQRELALFEVARNSSSEGIHEASSLSIRVFRRSPLVWVAASAGFIAAGVLSAAEDGVTFFALLCLAGGGLLGVLAFTFYVMRRRNARPPVDE